MAINSDAIGNMTSDGTWSYNWEHGRQLASMSSGSTTWSYTYNNDGMRVKRTNGSTTYTYFYNGDLLRYLDINGTKLYFVLDANGQPLEVSYQPAGTSGLQIYYFVMNLQGDVTAIVDTSGNPVVQYSYDAWGNILSVTGSMANTLGAQNPFRYRGYVYDNETELYYLQSRYYDPELGRFINADAFASTGQGLRGNNMFAYCGNNPIMCVDFTGCYAVAIDPSELADGGAFGYAGLGLSAIGVAIGKAVNDLWDSFEESVKKSLAKISTPRTYKSETEEHHMTAKGSYKAREAQIVLAKVFPDGTENPNNKVTLTTALHRRVHTNIYYAVTNKMIVNAYNSANGDEIQARNNVISTLNEIRIILEALQVYVQY